MTTPEFVKHFAEALEIEDYSNLDTTTRFRTLEEWDSLAYLSVIAMIDEEYDCQIETADFKKLDTIGDIINHISSK